ncbi:hypothetical protein [Rickettsiales endosymbiont of Trichoplax sp. H2]|uniref:hypothetical protein n=1 Tax=Rickettsiales endosymbiont of Trichoplax sp. H2 TaxID=2021221 RepID=UPI0012B3ADA0|nr:hypothetical protein [Rickettsiales endosymbiont of Trichoplax sp. H2]
MLPILNFKGTVVLVDDDINFLDASLKFLKKDTRKVQGLSNVSEAIKYCKNSIKIESIIPINNVLAEELENSAIELYVREIYKICNSDIKNNVIPVIIADYHMPEMDGIDLFEKLIKIVNLGRKKYFQRASKPYIDMILKNGSNSLLDSDKYSDFLWDIMDQKVEESYLLVDNSGNEKLLIISTIEKSESVSEICQESEYVSQEYINYIKAGQKILCTNESMINNDKLSNHIKDAKTLKIGDKKIFYYYGDNIANNGEKLIKVK